ncbi:MAG: hypothetical protein NVSMB19_00940 [Vulcanimicrobiaceae bacterium]
MNPLAVVRPQDRPLIVLVAGYAPYLGGPQTWRPLRAALDGRYEIVELDPLDFIEAASFGAAIERAIPARTALVVAYGSASGPAIRACAKYGSALLLVEPVDASTPRRTGLRRLVATALGAIVRTRAAGWALRWYSRRKLRGLRERPAYVREQLALLVATEALSDALVDEAVERVRDPRTDRVVARTMDGLRELVAPMPPTVLTAIAVRATIGRPSRVRRLIGRAWSPGEIVFYDGPAAMLEAPAFVARTIARLIDARR